MWLSIKHHAYDDVTAATWALVTDILKGTKRDTTSRECVEGKARVESLMRAGARVDAALELIALELPEWQLCRVAYDDGEWSCALSRYPNLPDWLDRAAEGRHADLALAILRAMQSARLSIEEATPGLPRLTSPGPDLLDEPLCCDNFC